MSAIAQRFEQDSGHRVSLSLASSGKHYALITHGAPFDAFFSADAQRPELLDRQGVAVAGSRFTYAIGKLVLWSPRAAYVDAAGAVLEKGDFRHLALANPKLAPYGRAARDLLEHRGLWQALQNRLVRGENIGQTFQFVKSGNAELGLIAWSQIKQPGKTPQGSWWEPPHSLYRPIVQQAVMIKDSPPARAFMAFMRSAEVADMIRSYGYAAP
jgi:molybdate transport system substrate-binding protein